MSDIVEVRRSPWRTVILIAVLAALVYFLTLIPKTVEVFIVATLIAYGVNPIVRGLVRRMPRPVAIGLVYGVLVAVVIVAIVVIIPDTVGQLQVFFSNGSTYASDAQNVLAGLQQYIDQHWGSKVLPPQFQDIEGRAATEIATLLNTAVAGLGNLVLGIANMLVIGITGVVLSYFFLSHSEEIRDSFYSLFPERAQDTAHLFSREVSHAVGGFIVAQLVLCAFTGIATFLVLLIMRSNYALLLGVITGILYAVPYLGIMIALTCGVLLGALQSWPMAIGTAVVIFIITRIADLVLVPKVMGDSVGVSPMAIIFAVFAGGELFGLWGLVLAIPAAAIFKVAWRVWLHPWLTGREHPSIKPG
ncbi:MAG TPA: AI-2E family transporter [Candidatus Eremiobacteraceae bacterium]|nr:AI-2E family transporter [Candidatus Eremiobacteraceae bacterium]